MDVKIVSIPSDEIVDWETFHDVFSRVLGFPDFYGRNMNAWIDCMGDDDMREVKAAPDGMLILQIEKVGSFRKRCPEQHAALFELLAFVNFRETLPRLGILPIGRYSNPDDE